MKRLLIAAIAAMALTGGTAFSQDAFQTPKAGTIKLDLRLTGIVPDESGAILTAAGASTGLNVKVNDSFVPTIGIEYYVNPAVSLELIAGSGNHKVKAVGGATNVEVSELWHVPPTLTAKYHFAPEARVSPYIGAGFIPTCVECDSGGGFPKSWKCESMASLIWRAWLWDQRLACGMILTERH